ncbi:MAG: rubredoxin [Mycoplasmoidaceae bacterium]|nr:rubredoxin [Mycoplasmoidaceae bacterium]
MAIYVCDLCGYEYDEAKEGPFAKQPDSYTCPICQAKKSQFTKQ